MPSRRSIRNLWPRAAILFFASNLMLSLMPSDAFAARTPPARAIVLTSQPGSGNYLKHVDEPVHEKTLKERVFNHSMSSELGQRYSAIIKERDEAHAYGLNRLETELRFQQQNRDLRNWAMRRLLDDNLRRPVRKFVVREFKNTVRSLRESRPATDAKSGRPSNPAASSPTAKTATTASSSNNAKHHQEERTNGLSISEIYMRLENFYNHGLWLDSKTLMRFQYDIPGGVMDLAFTGSIVDASFDYFVRPLEFSLLDGGLSNAQTQAERMQITMSKSLGDFGLSTGMHYGLMTRALDAGMNKHLVGPLSAGVSQSYYATNPSRNETTYRLNFGLAF